MIIVACEFKSILLFTHDLEKKIRLQHKCFIFIDSILEIEQTGSQSFNCESPFKGPIGLKNNLNFEISLNTQWTVLW